jgi:hypothetical protein
MSANAEGAITRDCGRDGMTVAMEREEKMER